MPRQRLLYKLIQVSTYPAGTGATEYFLMRPVGKPGNFDRETAEVRWVTFDEAKQLIAQTTNAKGGDRDQKVLTAAITTYKEQ